MKLNKTISVTRLQIGEEQHYCPKGEIVNLLKSKQFVEFEIGEDFTLGWTGFNDVSDTELKDNPVERAEFLFFSLRLDTKKVPSLLLKKELDIALKKEKEQNPKQKYIARLRKQELKDRVKIRLLSKTMPSPKLVNVVWDYDKKLLYVHSVSLKDVERVQAHFTATFGLTTSEWYDELGRISGSEFLKWIWYYGECSDALVMPNRTIKSGSVFLMVDGNSGSVSTKNKQDEAKFALARGLEIKTMAVEISSTDDLMFWSFKLSTNLSRLQSLKLPIPPPETDEDEDNSLYEHVAMTEAAFAVVLAAYEMADTQSGFLTDAYASWLEK